MLSRLYKRIILCYERVIAVIGVQYTKLIGIVAGHDIGRDLPEYLTARGNIRDVVILQLDVELVFDHLVHFVHGIVESILLQFFGIVPGTGLIEAYHAEDGFLVILLADSRQRFTGGRFVCRGVSGSGRNSGVHIIVRVGAGSKRQDHQEGEQNADNLFHVKHSSFPNYL